ncbi:cyclase [Streptomyces sp. Ru73]|uniref:SRPBCC family protein n=1 Tax=Streptomyces sp. Ru73 TaxID=2080748 RepID=UPI000CDDD76B|nr:SRPBCC family protein [Streptomyces sp. Ru73]POX42739.1 cyclase [Streptomyces sp. Ru73]
MSTIEHSVDVDVPLRTAYNQWTQFETFPRFMEGVQRVDRPQSNLTHWITRFGGVTREFDAEIVEQRPDERLVWRSLHDPRHTGTVTFHSLGEGSCRVDLRLDFTPQGLVERAGDGLGVLRRRVCGDLECFKQFIEAQGRETGQWRGAIDGGHVLPDSGQKQPHVPTWPTG